MRFHSKQCIVRSCEWVTVSQNDMYLLYLFSLALFYYPLFSFLASSSLVGPSQQFSNNHDGYHSAQITSLPSNESVCGLSVFKPELLFSISTNLWNKNVFNESDYILVPRFFLSAYCLLNATCWNTLRPALCSQGQPWFLCGASSEWVTVWQKPLRCREIGRRKRWEIHFCNSFEPNWLRQMERKKKKKAGEHRRENELKDKEAKDYNPLSCFHQWASYHLQSFVVGVVLVVAVVVRIECTWN